MIRSHPHQSLALKAHRYPVDLPQLAAATYVSLHPDASGRHVIRAKTTAPAGAPIHSASKQSSQTPKRKPECPLKRQEQRRKVTQHTSHTGTIIESARPHVLS
ncbi:hypothetical protein MRX96_042285 [Rhipicephalus microplus]